MIILASKSPRRKQLLSMMGLEFTVQTADIDETMDPSQTPAHEVAAVSARKAEKIAAQHPQDVIVSADTIVVIDGKILGKPKDEQDAARMLRLLSGRTHTVYTGLTVHADGKANMQVVSTGVTFRRFPTRKLPRISKRRSRWTRRAPTAFRATAQCLSRTWTATISA